MKEHPKPVEDYTLAFLGSSFLVLMVTLCTLWATYNFAVALTFAGVLYLGINKLPVKD